jgi:D-Tyr-tRNAtyr deacylase
MLESMKGPEAKVLYNHVLDELGKGLPGGKDNVKGRKPTTATANSVDGVFGAMMQVDISNDVCPRTIQLTRSGSSYNHTRHEERRNIE